MNEYGVDKTEGTVNEYPPVTPPEKVSPTEELLYSLIAAWKMDMFKGMFYRMTRTWAHFRLGEPYNSRIIFEQLDALQHGHHSELLQSVDDFSSLLITELREHIQNSKL